MLSKNALKALIAIHSKAKKGNKKNGDFLESIFPGLKELSGLLSDENSPLFDVLTTSPESKDPEDVKSLIDILERLEHEDQKKLDEHFNNIREKNKEAIAKIQEEAKQYKQKLGEYQEKVKERDAQLKALQREQDRLSREIANCNKKINQAQKKIYQAKVNIDQAKKKFFKDIKELGAKAKLDLQPVFKALNELETDQQATTPESMYKRLLDVTDKCLDDPGVEPVNLEQSVITRFTDGEKGRTKDASKEVQEKTLEAVNKIVGIFKRNHPDKLAKEGSKCKNYCATQSSVIKEQSIVIEKEGKKLDELKQRFEANKLEIAELSGQSFRPPNPLPPGGPGGNGKGTTPPPQQPQPTPTTANQPPQQPQPQSPPPAGQPPPPPQQQSPADSNIPPLPGGGGESNDLDVVRLQSKIDKLQEDMEKSAEEFTAEQVTAELPANSNLRDTKIEVNKSMRGKIKMFASQDPDYTLDKLSQEFVAANESAINTKVGTAFPPPPPAPTKAAIDAKREELKGKLDQAFRAAMKKPFTEKLDQMSELQKQLTEAKAKAQAKAQAKIQQQKVGSPANDGVGEPSPVPTSDKKDEPKSDADSEIVAKPYKDYIEPVGSQLTPQRAAVALGLAADCKFSELKSKAVEQGKAIAEAAKARDDSVLSSANADQQAVYLKLRSVIDGPLVAVGGIDLSTPEGMQQAAFKTMAHTLAGSLGIDPQEMNDDELRKALQDKAKEAGIAPDKVEAFINQLQAAVQFRLAIGATKKTSLEKLSDENEIERYLGELKKQDQEYRDRLDKGVGDPVAVESGWKRFKDALTGKEKPSWEEYLKKHAKDEGGGLYSQIGPDGSTHYSMTTVTEDNVKRIVDGVKGPGVLWTNLNKGPERDMAELASLKEWKTARFEGGNGRNGLSDLSKCLPERPGDWAGWLKNIGEQHGTGVLDSKAHALYGKLIKKVVGNDAEKLREFWNSVIESKDPALREIAEKHLTAAQKKTLNLSYDPENRQLAEAKAKYDAQLSFNASLEKPEIAGAIKEQQGGLKELEGKEQAGKKSFDDLEARYKKLNQEDRAAKDLEKKLNASETELKGIREGITAKQDMLNLLTNPKEFEKEWTKTQQELDTLKEDQRVETENQAKFKAAPETKPAPDATVKTKLESYKAASDKKLDELKLKVTEKEQRLKQLDERKKEVEGKHPGYIEQLKALQDKGASPNPASSSRLELARIQQQQQVLDEGHRSIQALVNPPKPQPSKSYPGHTQQQPEPKPGEKPVPETSNPKLKILSQKPEALSPEEERRQLSARLEAIINGPGDLEGMLQKIGDESLGHKLTTACGPSVLLNMLKKEFEGVPESEREKLKTKVLERFKKHFEDSKYNPDSLTPNMLREVIEGAKELIKVEDKKVEEDKKNAQQDPKPGDPSPNALNP